MSIKKQITKNLELSQKLFDYLSKNPHKAPYKDVSYIVVSKDDKKLNKANLNLAKVLIKKGKKVIKAIETNKKITPWRFASA